MTKLKLEIDYKRRKEQIAELSNIEMTANYLEFIAITSHKEGMKGQVNRIWGRLQRKIADAVHEKKKEIQIEEAEKDFVIKAIADATYDPKLSKYFIIFEDEVIIEEKENKNK